MNKLDERFDTFQQSYDEAVAGIRSLLETEKEYEKDVSTLIKWMMETDINLYSFLPANWVGCLTDAVSFYALCCYIHHAMVDDGYIDFIKVNDSPRITFIERCDIDDKLYDDYVNTVLSGQERDWKKNGFGPHNKKMEYTITYFNNVNEFITAIEEYEINQLKKWVIAAMRRKNLEELNHYRENPRFKEEWVKDYSILAI